MYFDVFDQINNIYMCMGDNEHTLELRLWTSRITTDDLIACMQEIVAQQHPPENIWRKPNGKQPTHRNYPDYVDKLSLPPPPDHSPFVICIYQVPAEEEEVRRHDRRRVIALPY
ncbi:hypothetical protein L798_00103 [Zootermopsis nevadensis]|uniref:Uncharacterized protein n=1 Tax=Zootermopsis nevadensis TaxID=136037 RepID=A0A067RN18_ZOONE|nr:hypothetical protein L798_00103 [Zootermopsis nevadensis]